jgi:23S rRNA (pseudouridine1915-N3)-methyltransferase
VILRLLHPGSASKGPLDDAAAIYKKRIRGLRVEERFLKAEKISDKGKAGVQLALQREADRLLQAVGSRDRLVVLDPKGNCWTSTETSKRLQQWMSNGHQAVCFVLGSAYGLDDSVRNQAQDVWSFGNMTLPHDLARVVLWEQIYRAQSILKGEPYHK